MSHARPPTFTHLLTVVAPWAFALALGGSAHLALVLHEVQHEIEDQDPIIAARPWPDPAPVPAPAPAQLEAPTQRSSLAGCEKAIEVRPETAILDRNFVDNLLANPPMLAKQARIVPSQKDGETQGFKLYGIRRGSLPRLLGFKNGDMIVSVGGHDLASVDACMRAYEQLKPADALDVVYIRKGERRVLHIEIR